LAAFRNIAPFLPYAYLPPNQLEMPLFASEVLASTFLSNSSTFFIALAFASFAYASALALALEASLCALLTYNLR
jgi:hypothetical protein